MGLLHRPQGHGDRGLGGSSDGVRNLWKERCLRMTEGEN